MKSMINWLDELTLKHIMQLELLLVTTLPVLILLAFVGFTHFVSIDIEFFVVSFILCSILLVLGEVTIVLLTQHVLKKHLLEIASFCQDIALGHTTRRLWVRGQDEFAIIAHSLNTLLDTMSGKGDKEHEGLFAYTMEQSLSLETQLESLLQHISSVVNGDLRVRASVTPDTVGVVADAFNYLVDELSHVVKRVQFASNQILSTTRDLLQRSIELAQHVDGQIASLELTTTTTETIAASLQHLSRLLQPDILQLEEVSSASIQNGASTDQTAGHDELVYLRHMQETIVSLNNKLLVMKRLTQQQEHSHQPTTRGETRHVFSRTEPRPTKKPRKRVQRLTHLMETAVRHVDQLSFIVEQAIQAQEPFNTTTPSAGENGVSKMQRYLQTLFQASQTVQSNTSYIEHVVTQLYTLLAQTQQQNATILNSAERISNLATLAEQWRDSVASFLFIEENAPEDEIHDEIHKEPFLPLTEV